MQEQHVAPDGGGVSSSSHRNGMVSPQQSSSVLETGTHPYEESKQEQAQKSSKELTSLPKILVVEDDLTLASLEAHILSAHGFSVVAVDSGEQAIFTLGQSLPDLVVLDLELTGKVQGWDVLQVLRATTSNTPVLLTTSSANTVRELIHDLGESRGTLDHLPKPYPMHTLLKRVKRLLTVAPH